MARLTDFHRQQLVFKTVAILALQGHFSASGGRAFLASPKSSPAVDGEGGRAAYISPSAADAPTTLYSIEIVFVMCMCLGRRTAF
jgi:hypothetical protein